MNNRSRAPRPLRPSTACCNSPGEPLMHRFVVATVVVFFVSALRSTVDAAERLNVLFIMADDLNDWIGPLRGHPQVRTPNLDRLARRGVTFANAHCASPL